MGYCHRRVIKMPRYLINRKLSNSESVALMALCLGFLCFIGYSLYYSVNTFHYPPQADDYRLTLYHIKPFLDGTWQPKQLWSDVHPNPIHGALLIWSSVYERMTFTSLPYIGFLFLLIKWGAFSQVFNHSLDNNISLKARALTILWMGFIIFGFNTPQQYLWNSVVIAHVYHAVSALFLLLLVKSLKNCTFSQLTLLLMTTVFFLVTSRQFATPWVYASLAGLIFVSIRDRKKIFTTYGRLIATLLVALLCEAIFYMAMDIDIYYESTLQDLMKRIYDLVKFSFVELSLPIIYPWWLNKLANVNMVYIKAGVVFVSFLFLYTTLIAALNIRRNNLYLVSLIAFTFTAITILATVAYRTDANTNWLINHIPRYIVFRNIGIIAIIWTLLISMNINRVIRITNGILLSILFLIFVSTQYLHINYESNDQQRRLISQQRVIHQLQFTYDQLRSKPKVGQDEIRRLYKQKYNRNYTLAIGNPEIKSHRWKLQVISFWGDNNLNVFKTNLE